MSSASSFSRPGWCPAEVKPWDHPEFEISLRSWLLTLLPGEIYGQRVLHRHIDVLLHIAKAEILGALTGLRAAYATARTELGASHQPETVAAAMRAIAELGELRGRQLEFVAEVIERRS